MNGQTALGWVCQNQGIIGPILAVVLPASILSGWTDKMPTWAAHIINALSLNWGDIVRAVVIKLETPPGGNP